MQQEEEQVEEGEEQEQNVPPGASPLSLGTVVPLLPGSRDPPPQTGDVGIWEGNSGWL